MFLAKARIPGGAELFEQSPLERGPRSVQLVALGSMVTSLSTSRVPRLIPNVDRGAAHQNHRLKLGVFR